MYKSAAEIKKDQERMMGPAKTHTLKWTTICLVTFKCASCSSPIKGEHYTCGHCPMKICPTCRNYFPTDTCPNSHALTWTAASKLNIYEVVNCSKCHDSVKGVFICQLCDYKICFACMPKHRRTQCNEGLELKPEQFPLGEDCAYCMKRVAKGLRCDSCGFSACEGCANAAMKQPAKAKAPEQLVKELCKVCFDGESTAALQPCGHLGMCVKCAASMKVCPFCRGKVTGFLKIFQQ